MNIVVKPSGALVVKDADRAFLDDVLAGLLAYCHQPKKPSLQVTPEVLALWGH